MGEVLENFILHSGLNRRMREQRILDSWREVVGGGIAERTEPIRVQDKILQVRVSNSVWMQQLQYMKGMLLDKLKKYGAEDLEDMRFFIGELKEDREESREGEGEEGRKEWEDLTESEKNYIKKEVATLSDPEMRRIFESVFARGFAVRKSGRMKKEVVRG